MGKFAKGFTLVELLIVISIVAILAAVAIPSYQSSIANTRMSSEMDAVAMDLSFARSEAIKRGNNVAICPTAGCDGDNSWDQGWTVFVDPTGDLSGIEESDNVLKQESAFSSKDTLGNIDLDNGISFDRNGHTKASGRLVLTESTENDSLLRCLIFSTGSWPRQVGATCNED